MAFESIVEVSLKRSWSKSVLCARFDETLTKYPVVGVHGKRAVFESEETVSRHIPFTSLVRQRGKTSWNSLWLKWSWVEKTSLTGSGEGDEKRRCDEVLIYLLYISKTSVALCLIAAADDVGNLGHSGRAAAKIASQWPTSEIPGNLEWVLWSSDSFTQAFDGCALNWLNLEIGVQHWIVLYAWQYSSKAPKNGCDGSFCGARPKLSCC